MSRPPKFPRWAQDGAYTEASASSLVDNSSPSSFPERVEASSSGAEKFDPLPTDPPQGMEVGSCFGNSTESQHGASESNTAIQVRSDGLLSVSSLPGKESTLQNTPQASIYSRKRRVETASSARLDVVFSEDDVDPDGGTIHDNVVRKLFSSRTEIDTEGASSTAQSDRRCEQTAALGLDVEVSPTSPAPAANQGTSPRTRRYIDTTNSSPEADPSRTADVNPAATSPSEVYPHVVNHASYASHAVDPKMEYSPVLNSISAYPHVIDSTRDSPHAINQGVENLQTVNPTTSSPLVVNSNMSDPLVSNPVTGRPHVVNLTTANLHVANPAGASPLALKPRMCDPRTVNQEIGRSHIVDSVRAIPQVANPMAAGPQAVNPATPNPQVVNSAEASSLTLKPRTPSPHGFNQEMVRTPFVNAVMASPQVVHPMVTNPQAVNPATADPQVTNPVMASQQAVSLASANPQIVNPVTADPYAVNPASANPQVVNPVRASPHAVNPATAYPQVTDPAMGSLSVVDPEMASPRAANTTTVNLHAVNPAVEESHTINPAAPSPSTVNPTMSNPQAVTLKTASPHVANPQVANLPEASPNNVDPLVLAPPAAASTSIGRPLVSQDVPSMLPGNQQAAHDQDVKPQAINSYVANPAHRYPNTTSATHIGRQVSESPNPSAPMIDSHGSLLFSTCGTVVTPPAVDSSATNLTVVPQGPVHVQPGHLGLLGGDGGLKTEPSAVGPSNTASSRDFHEIADAATDNWYQMFVPDERLVRESRRLLLPSVLIVDPHRPPPAIPLSSVLPMLGRLQGPTLPKECLSQPWVKKVMPPDLYLGDLIPNNVESLPHVEFGAALIVWSELFERRLRQNILSLATPRDQKC